MNTQKLAAALTNLADALYEISESLTEQPAIGKGTGAGVASGAVSPPGAAPDDLPPLPPLMEEAYADELEEQPKPILQGSAGRCPKHKLEYRSGRNNTKFCPSPSDDPAWRNSKGYCTITPRNADVWLRAQASVPA